MSTIRLAGNFIDYTTSLLHDGYGHLQIVRVDGASQTELEVQGPWNFMFGGDWIFEPEQDHITNTPNYGDPQEYQSLTIDFGAQDQDEDGDCKVDKPIMLFATWSRTHQIHA